MIFLPLLAVATYAVFGVPPPAPVTAPQPSEKFKQRTIRRSKSDSGLHRAESSCTREDLTRKTYHSAKANKTLPPDKFFSSKLESPTERSRQATQSSPSNKTPCRSSASTTVIKSLTSTKMESQRNSKPSTRDVARSGMGNKKEHNTKSATRNVEARVSANTKNRKQCTLPSPTPYAITKKQLQVTKSMAALSEIQKGKCVETSAELRKTSSDSNPFKATERKGPQENGNPLTVDVSSSTTCSLPNCSTTDSKSTDKLRKDNSSLNCPGEPRKCSGKLSKAKSSTLMTVMERNKAAVEKKIRQISSTRKNLEKTQQERKAPVYKKSASLGKALSENPRKQNFEATAQKDSLTLSFEAATGNYPKVPGCVAKQSAEKETGNSPGIKSREAPNNGSAKTEIRSTEKADQIKPKVERISTPDNLISSLISTSRAPVKSSLTAPACPALRAASASMTKLFSSQTSQRPQLEKRPLIPQWRQIGAVRSQSCSDAPSAFPPPLKKRRVTRRPKAGGASTNNDSAQDSSDRPSDYPPRPLPPRQLISHPLSNLTLSHICCYYVISLIIFVCMRIFEAEFADAISKSTSHFADVPAQSCREDGY